MATSSSPSSSASPPGLLQSPFSSVEDDHNVEPPQTPHTPARGRSRYPSSLAPDGPRVPLHRRGTSKTYERLEDLLKEAGYKETRIFTPEADRHREHEQVREEGRQRDGKLKNGVDAMVGFLSGLVLGQADDQPAGLRAPRTHDRAEPSPLVSPRTRKSKVASNSSSTVRASSSQTQGVQGHAFTSSGQADSTRPLNVHASPARAYLRHIASAPNIPRRRHLGERVPTAVAKKSVTSLKDDHRAQHSPLPPMPTSWLETVARAVLNFPGARVGGPNGVPSQSSLLLSPGRSRFGHSSLPSSRSGTVRGRPRPNCEHATSPLEDTTVRLRGRSTPSLPASSNSLHPPTLVAMRSHVSLGQVVRVNVVCRSAPASRSSSVVGRKSGSDSPASASFGNLSSGSVRRRGRASRAVGRKHRRNNQERLADSGLSLRGRVEGDFILHPPGDGDSYDSSSEDEDEDEDEVDLSKLLVHTRRQRSIKSLRRHLEREPKPRDGDDDSLHGNGTWTLHGGDDSATASESGGRIRRGSVNDGDWGVLLAPGTGRDSRSLHRRRGIPGPWMQQSGSSRR